MYSKEYLSEAHRNSFANRKNLKIHQKCGCFYCGRMFDAGEIKDWSFDVPEDTALCPYCGIDSVLGETEGISITEELLKEMYAEWFQ